MIYEHRSYTLLPGKKAEFIQSFGKLMPLFDRHGAKVVGVWHTDVGESNEIIYILGFKDFAQREKFWDDFRRDQVFIDYQKGGTRASSVVNKILRPTDYSPMK